MSIVIALQPYGGFIDTLCLYKYLPIKKIFLNRNFYRNKPAFYCSYDREYAQKTEKGG